MTDRESVITHLQIIHTWAEFARERDLQFFTAKHLEDIAQWADDALALLKAQEPRLMTPDEIGNALKMPLWKETKSAHKDLYNGWVLAYDIQKGQGITGTRLGMSEPSGRVVWYRLADYGKTWRLWTEKPTAEQMEATLWEN